jgi:hypothetical protein
VAGVVSVLKRELDVWSIYNMSKKFEHFTEFSIADGLEPNEFYFLDDDIKQKLIKLMARISEKSYRRGLQHGSFGIAAVDPAHLRFNISPEYSPLTDIVDKDGNWVNNKESSIDRLKMEYGVLRDIGLDV